MFFRAAALISLAALAAWPAGNEKVGTARGENEDLIVRVNLYTTPEEVKDLLGNDLGGHFIVADVKVEPKYGKSVTVARDDFLMVNTDNNDRSTPFAPSQIAGHAAIVVKRASDEKGEKGNKPQFSGLGISSPGDMPVDRNLSAKVENADQPPDKALEKQLNDKQLAEKTTDQPVSGLLYFAYEKVKLKNMELYYGQKPNRMELHFKEAKK